MTRVSVFLATTALALALSGGPVWADATAAAADQVDTVFTVGEVIVTANAHGGLAEKTLFTSVDRLGPDVIERQNVDNAWQLLARLPGMLLTEFHQGTTSGRFSMRAFNGEGEINAVKLLIDGTPSNTNDGAPAFIDSVFPLEIAGVEVVRGTNDPRYGLNAIAGSAGVTTREGGDYGDARISYGSWNAAEAQLAVGRQGERAFYNLFAAARSSDGYRRHSGLDRGVLSAKLGYDGEAGRLVFSARHYRAEAEEPGYLIGADAAATPERSYAISDSDGGERTISQLAMRREGRLSERLSAEATLYANRFDDIRFVRFSEPVPQQERVARERQAGLAARLRYDVSPALLVEAGVDAQQQDVVSRRYLTTERVRTRQTRDQTYGLDTLGGYLLATWRPTPSLSLVPAYRFDRVDGDYLDRLSGMRAEINDYGRIDQPKLSVTWSAADGAVVYGNWGRTFQIGVGSGAYKLPPRQVDLAPSINEGWEFGVKLTRADRLNTRIALWRQTATGEVKRKLNDPTGDSENLGATERQGVDLQASFSVSPGLRLWAAATLQRAVIDEPDPAIPAARGKSIDHVPGHLYSGGLDWKVTDRLAASATFNAQDGYYLEQTNSTGRFGAHRIVNLDLAYTLTDRVEINAQIKNLGDARHEYVWWDGTQALHAPGDPRAIYGALKVRF